MNKLDISGIELRPFEKISKEWMLISAGTKEKMNMMTASWGTMGTIWNKPAVFIFVRPTRYTLGFIEQQPYFSLSFFDRSRRDLLSYCGTHSGRNVDKIACCGLTPVFDRKAPYFTEAQLVFICRKLYRQILTESGFADRQIICDSYPKGDFHYMFVGKVEEALG